MTSTPLKTALVLGASGRFGAAAAAAFAASGWQVLAQARSAGAELPEGVQRIEASLDDPASLARIADGACVVVHALNPPYTRWKDEALPLLRAGVEVATRLGATFMLPGNVYNYGEPMPVLLREDTPQQPTTKKGRIRCAMEAELEAASAAGLRSVVVRAGDFFGGGTGNWFDSAIAKRVGSGRLVYPGPLHLPHAWAYLPDLARAFVAIAEQRDRLDPFARLHFAGHTLTGAEMLAAIETAAHSLGIGPERAFTRGGLPWWLLRAGGHVLPMWREITEMAYLWQAPHALDGSALQALIGPLPATRIDIALRAALPALQASSVPPSAESPGIDPLRKVQS